jgi:hypothetical protein
MRRAALFLLILFVCCKKAEEPVSSADSTSTAVSVQEKRAIAPASTAAAATTPKPRVIRTARMLLSVKNVAAAVAAIEHAAAQSNGYVAYSRRWSEGENERGTLTIRVPEARLDAFLEASRHTATRVQSEELSGDDVSQEFVDLSAQLKNLEVTEVELRQLVSSVRARTQKAADVLEVYRELVTIRGEIERVRGRLQYLEQMTSFATINIDLLPDAASQTAVKQGWQPRGEMIEASRALSATLQWMADVAIWFVIYLAPLLLILGGLVALLRRAATTLRTKKLAAD